MNKDIVFNSKHFASIYSFEEMEEGLNFLTNDNSFIQVGTWNYEKNQILDAHYHNYFERKSYRTQEVVIVLEGKIRCNLFSEDNYQKKYKRGKMLKNAKCGNAFNDARGATKLMINFVLA